MDRRTFVAVTSAAPLMLMSEPLWSRPPAVATDMLVHMRVPHNAEPRLAQLVESWITPTDRFYVRSHAPVPKIDVDAYRLSVEGLVERPLSLSLQELKSRFKAVTATATMTCAGNRRSEHSLVKQIKGVPWEAGAIGNATWTGVRLSELLKHVKILAGAKHVWFEGLDEIDRPTGVIPFGASIPLKKAMTDEPSMPGCLVTYQQNGQALTPDHGYPVRTVTPGYIGARSVKWLGRIVVSDRPSPNHYVATAYKLVEKGTDDEWATSAPLEEFVANSVTCVPAANAVVTGKQATVRGYALAAGKPGCKVQRVEISTDGGQRWIDAGFERDARPYCWTLWSARIDVSHAMGSILVRATDSNGAVQPETVAWNLKGYQFNAWHKTPITFR